jgi:hydroxymethylbilane synthase
LAWIRKTETAKHTFTIGSRGSQLALIQTRAVLAELEKANPDIKFELTTIVTTGDRRRTRSTSLDEGMFVKEIEEALLSSKIDLAVHSLKDLPTKIPAGLCLAAVTKRLDPRDILVSNSGNLAELPANSTIGTGSPRRTAQLLAYRHDLKVQPIRGNIETRLRKVSSGEVSGVVIAAAGMIRLGLNDMITEYLPLEFFLPTVGQAALGIESRGGDIETAVLVSSLNHEPTWRSVSAERAFLHTLGGGCHTPVAALATADGDAVKLQGMVASSDGSGVLRDAEEGSRPEEVGKRLAERMLEMGAAELIIKARTR